MPAAHWPFVQLAGRRVLVPEIRVRVAGGQPRWFHPLVVRAPLERCAHASPDRTSIAPGGAADPLGGRRPATVGPLPHITAPSAPAPRRRSFAARTSGWRRMTA